MEFGTLVLIVLTTATLLNVSILVMVLDRKCLNPKWIVTIALFIVWAITPVLLVINGS